MTKIPLEEMLEAIIPLFRVGRVKKQQWQQCETIVMGLVSSSASVHPKFPVKTPRFTE